MDEIHQTEAWKKTIKFLIVEDEDDVRAMIIDCLHMAGYDGAFYEARNGQEALDAVIQKQIDLVLLDYRMPVLSGMEVLKKMKADILLRHIPVIMLTAKDEVEDKVGGLTAGADDYVTKPFEPRELAARIEMILKRTTRDLEANPLTHLPGNISIQNELNRRLAGDGLYAICYLDINKFKFYNDTYGFNHGDRIIAETAKIMVRAIEKFGNDDDFVGHIGGDDYVFVTRVKTAEPICKYIVNEFDTLAPNFYNDSDRSKGFIIAIDRQGKTQKIPLLSIVICVVTNEYRKFTHIAEISTIEAELKICAKGFEKSVYIMDQRR